jgi:prepilin-type N-terminal cleavage/methylation domain-containing protein
MRKDDMRNGDGGFTLLELMIVTGIIATVIGLSMVMLKQAGDDARMNILMSHYESRLQTALDDIVMHAIETNPSKMSLYAYDEDGQRHAVITFPTARDVDDQYALFGPGGVVTPTPQWQALVVYAYSRGSIYRYMDFTARDYTNIAYVTAITANTITVFDGSALIMFNRDGTPRNANQRVWKLLEHASRLFAFVPAKPGDPPESQMPPDPQYVLPAVPRYDPLDPPVSLLLQATVPIEHSKGTAVVISLDTSVLARNQN